MGFSLPLPLRRNARRGRGRRESGAWQLPAIRIPTAALCAIAALPALGGGWLWFRNSSLVAVEQVHIAGVQAGPEAIEIRRALVGAGRSMSTLRYSVSGLRAAVRAYPIVAGLHASSSFPHTLSIQVSEREPVAILVGPGRRTAIAADGTVLGGALASEALPSVAIAGSTPAAGRPVRAAFALQAATVLGGAPAVLLRYVERVYQGGEGLTLQMRNGLLVYFGDASLPHAKWLSLARVLSSPQSSGALYVDVRLPSRPAAGFSQPGSSAATSAGTGLGAGASGAASAAAAAQVGSADPTSAALAQRLAQSLGLSGAGRGSANGAAPTGGATTSQAGESGKSGASGESTQSGESGESGGSSTPAGSETEAGGTSPGG